MTDWLKKQTPKSSFSQTTVVCLLHQERNFSILPQHVINRLHGNGFCVTLLPTMGYARLFMDCIEQIQWFLHPPDQMQMRLPYLTLIVCPRNDSVTAILLPPPERSLYNFAWKMRNVPFYADLSHKGICKFNNTFLQYMLTKGIVSFIALRL